MHAVWDAGTRWFHWVNALCVVVLAAIGIVLLNAGGLGVSDAGKAALKTVHVWIGYVFVLNLGWRIVWAFFGNRYARWRAILPGGRGYGEAVRSYVTAFTGGPPRHYLGHSPLGRLSVAVLLLLLCMQAVTGLVLAGTDLFYPPIGHWIARWVAAADVAPDLLVPYAPQMYDPAAYEAMRAFRSPFALVHLYSFYALGILLVLHVAAVVVTEIREGGTIVSAMFTGRKIIAGRAVDEDEP